VSTFEFNGEAIFGQDRIDTLRWRIEHNGLKASRAKQQKL